MRVVITIGEENISQRKNFNHDYFFFTEINVNWFFFLLLWSVHDNTMIITDNLRVSMEKLFYSLEILIGIENIKEIISKEVKSYSKF